MAMFPGQGIIIYDGNASAADLEKAKSLVGKHEIILAITRPSDEQVKNMSMQPIVACLIMPCFWPPALMCSPCLAGAIMSGRANLKGTMYVITNQNVYRYVDAEGMRPCPTTGYDSGSISLNDINSVGSDLPGELLVRCGQQFFPTKQLNLGIPPGSTLANAGGSKHSPANRIVIPVSEPDALQKLVREAKDNFMLQNQQQGAMMLAQQMQGMQMQTQSLPTAWPIVVAEPVQPQAMEMEDPSERMLKLKKMLDAGVITLEEFEAKKAEIMASL